MQDARPGQSIVDCGCATVPLAGSFQCRYHTPAIATGYELHAVVLFQHQPLLLSDLRSMLSETSLKRFSCSGEKLSSRSMRGPVVNTVFCGSLVTPVLSCHPLLIAYLGQHNSFINV
ncbi:hypothetical protein CGCF413_v012531 [Colletotrichum fructicola]|nr:hypothetical protein CGCF413_v012531 [Colletotrichum fructicola]